MASSRSGPFLLNCLQLSSKSGRGSDSSPALLAKDWDSLRSLVTPDVTWTLQMQQMLLEPLVSEDLL